jgi:hypothetical protein
MDDGWMFHDVNSSRTFIIATSPIRDSNALQADNLLGYCVILFLIEKLR